MKVRLCFCLAITVWLACLEAVAGNDVTGYWIMPSGDVVVEVINRNSAESDDELVVILQRTLRPQLDERNPDPELRTRGLQGVELGDGFKASGDEWSGGKIYDPGTGKTYRAKLSLVDPDHLQLRGYVGVPAFGRTQILIRLGTYVAWFDAMVGGVQ